MSKGCEDHIKNVVTTKITRTHGYPDEADKTENGVTWYKEGSYNKVTKITNLLSGASKNQTGYAGTPDFLIDCPNFYIVIETKGITNGHKHSNYADVKHYLNPDAKKNEDVYSISALTKSAVDDVLYYATFLNGDKDVIAVGASGDDDDKNFRWTSFYLPKGENLSKLYLLEDCNKDAALMTISEYKDKINEVLGKKKATYAEISEGLRKYVDACAKFLDTNGVDAADRLKLVSAVTLALTNEDSDLVRHRIPNHDIIRARDVLDALISDQYGIIIKDKLPRQKSRALKENFEGVLNKSKLDSQIKVENGKESCVSTYFIENMKDSSIIGRLTNSLKVHIKDKWDEYKDSGIDIMGTFYSLFLQYVKSDVKKGIVLTPKHITELFCDLAEHFADKPLTDKTKVLDICTGSGGFLISALNRMDKNIDSDNSLSLEEKRARKIKARENCLIGIELTDSMFVLAYANMRFHGDGKSSLYHGSSLYESKEKLADDKTFVDILASWYSAPNASNCSDLEKIKECGPDIGFINPPYEEDVFKFMESMLMYLKRDGIGIAIVPISSLSTNAGTQAKKDKLLSEHTLLASILMPPSLFVGVRGSGAATATCILVFKAHRPHKDFVNNKKLTYLADWSEDGFKIVNKQGRIEQNHKWSNPENGYKVMYLNDLRNAKTQGDEDKNILITAYNKDIHDKAAKKSVSKAINVLVDTVETHVKEKGKISEGIMVRKERYANEDWNILSYVDTDYSVLSEDDFISTLFNYKLYKYMRDNDLLFEDEN